MKLENTEVSRWDSLALQLREAKSKSKSQGRPRAAGTQPWPHRQRAQHQPALLGGMAGTPALPLFLGAPWQCQGLGRAVLWPRALMVEHVLQERGRTAPRIPAGMEAPVPEMTSPTIVPAAQGSRAGSASWVSARLCRRAKLPPAVPGWWLSLSQVPQDVGHPAHPASTQDAQALLEICVMLAAERGAGLCS